MTVANIIKAVRWCIDEEAVNAASLDGASAYDFDGGTHTDIGLMNNIIRNKIPDALRWVCLYAPANMLGGTDETGQATGILVDAELSDQVTTDNGVELINATYCMKLKMPSNFIKLVRVRVEGWHKAIKETISEDSEEYLQLFDENGATATEDRPVAVLVEKEQSVIELWPDITAGTFYVEVTFATAKVDNVIYTDNNTEKVAVPPQVKTAFIYYLAFLLLSAYDDSRSVRMMEIARMNLGLTTDKQRQ